MKCNCDMKCGKTIKQINDEFVIENEKIDRALSIGMPIVIIVVGLITTFFSWMQWI